MPAHINNQCFTHLIITNITLEMTVELRSLVLQNIKR